MSAAIVEQQICVYRSRPGQPLHAVTVHATLEPPGGSATWTGSNPDAVRLIGSGATATVSGLAPGSSDLTVTYVYGGRSASDTIRCITYGVEIEHPSGDPVSAGAAANEFVYSAADPGVLTIDCRARVVPDGAEARACAEPHLFWEIDAIGSSARAWSSGDPGNANRGAGLQTTATFTGLPERNADFGVKTVRLLVEGAGVAVSTTIEVFWPKAAHNHPNMSGVPNWFYYWSQVVRMPRGVNIRYARTGRAGVFGETRAMLDWAYGAMPAKGAVHIRDSAATQDGAIAGLHGALTGIDLFANTGAPGRLAAPSAPSAGGARGGRVGGCRARLFAAVHPWSLAWRSPHEHRK